MQVENKTSGKYSTKKNAKSCSLKLEAHLLKEVGSSLSFLFFYCEETYVRTNDFGRFEHRFCYGS